VAFMIFFTKNKKFLKMRNNEKVFWKI